MDNYPSFLNLLKKRILTVGQLTEQIKDSIELEFGGDYTWVEGEISNFKDSYSSGHWYFSLKDSEAQISCVCFKSDNRHIKFLPENGTEVICCGQVGVYEKQGRYQLTCTYIEPKGVGAEAMALEQLKEKLLAEGLFDEARKRPLPLLPETLGVVTSPSGAAIKDIIKILGRRFPGIGVLICPARVQGEEAPRELTEALRRLYGVEEVDLIILARGGGSKEDLWAFNEEIVAREIAASPVPVISAVGHEIDITIADLVADVRAATPSMAAELAVREKAELVSELHTLRDRAASALKNTTELAARDLNRLEGELARTMENKVDRIDTELRSLSSTLEALSPLKVLERGYSITQKTPSGVVVTKIDQLLRGDTVMITLHRGRAGCIVEDVED